MAGKPQKLDVAPREIIDRCEQLVRSSGGRALTASDKKGLSELGIAALITALRARGLEYLEDKKKFRVPLEEQIAARLEEGSYLVRGAALKKQVQARDDRELTAAVERLCAAGKAHAVIRTKQEVLVPGRADVLSPAETAACQDLGTALAAMKKALASAKWPAATLLREDVRARVLPLMEILAPPAAKQLELSAAPGTSAMAPEPTPPLAQEVRRAIIASEDPTLRLVFVPDVVRSLLPKHPLEKIHAALFAEAAAEQIELRPEGGVRLLPREEIALCPPGPQGTVLSWLRRIGRPWTVNP